MKHIQAISRQMPAKAQFETILQLIATVQGILGLLGTIDTVFHTTFLDKTD